MRRLRKQQDRCQMTLAEKSNNYYVKSHGFALNRTVSCKCSRRGARPRSAAPTTTSSKWFGLDDSHSLPPHSDAQRTDVATGVERAQRDRMLAGSK
jgi:hypothetical protein